MATTEAAGDRGRDLERIEEADMSAMYGIAGQLGNISRGQVGQTIFDYLSSNVSKLVDDQPQVIGNPETLALLWDPAREQPSAFDVRSFAGLAAAELLAKCADRDPTAEAQRRAEDMMFAYATSLSRCGVFTTKAGALGSIIRSADHCMGQGNNQAVFSTRQASFANGIIHSLRARYWQERSTQAGVVITGVVATALIAVKGGRKR